MRSDTYSVWNWTTGKFDYYRAPARGYRDQVGYPLGSTSGVAPEDSVAPLPAGAQYAGSGDRAVGVVAAQKKRSGLVFVGLALAGLWALS